MKSAPQFKLIQIKRALDEGCHVWIWITGIRHSIYITAITEQLDHSVVLAANFTDSFTVAPEDILAVRTQPVARDIA